MSQKEYGLEDTLPWDFINVGLSKNWLQNEYKEAFKQTEPFNFQPTCENKCVNCGVCTSLKTHKVLAKPYTASEEAQKLSLEPLPDPTKTHIRAVTYKYRLKITKKGILRYFSHLDWQNTFHKVLA